MAIYYRFQKEPVLQAPTVFTFGTFDGVHLGHRQIFDAVQSIAKKENRPTALLTFSNHPLDVLNPSIRTPWLTSNEQKLQQLAAYGFDVILNVPFTVQLQQLTREQFLQLIQTMVPISSLVVGEDVAFGKDRKGDKKYLITQGFATVFVPKVLPISSSRIRQAIGEGKLDEAKELLGRPYAIEARRLGEAEWDPSYFAMPPEGAYQADIRYNGQTEWHDAVVTIGHSIEIDERNPDSHTVEIQLKKRM